MEMSMHVNHSIAKRVPLNIGSHNGNISKNQNPIIFYQLSMQREKTNFYQLLSLNPQNAEIKKAYKTMALQYHPDVCNSTPLTKEESTKRFIELRKAYETLSDPYLRRVYDYELGLEDSLGARFGCVRKRMEGGFPREVWERQLNGLRKKCGERTMNKGDANNLCKREMS